MILDSTISGKVTKSQFENVLKKFFFNFQYGEIEGLANKYKTNDYEFKVDYT